MIKLATPISHLFESKKMAEIILKNSDCLECRDFTIEDNSSGQELFHCELQPIHKWGDKQLDYLRKVADLKDGLKLVSFHLASCCDRPTIEGIWFMPGGKVYSREEMISNAIINFTEVKKIFGIEVSIVVENNNYYPTPAYENITDPDFIKEIVYSADIGLLLDISHASVTSHNKGISFEEYLNGLPIERVYQIHLCAHGIRNDNLAFDAHEPPREEEWSIVEEVYNRYGNVRYLTIEFYKDFDILCETLKFAREKINVLSRSTF